MFYTVRDLVRFMEEEIADLVCMVFDDIQKIYVPHGREWIKSKLYIFLKKYATKIADEE